ncbi:unnamed protein product [Withania somnifera]
MEGSSVFKIEETTINEIHQAFAQGKLTSRKLLDFYRQQIEILNPLLRGVIEINPEAQHVADEADPNRGNSNNDGSVLGGLHGIPNPYCPPGSPCGSSSGCAISVAANMAAVSLGTETHCSIICPADHNSVVGLKPTVGLTSRAGIITMMPLPDTVGRIEVTMGAAKYIPEGGYKQFLKENGLQRKRIGIVRHPFIEMIHRAIEKTAFEHHLDLLRQQGAILVDNLSIPHIEEIMDSNLRGEALVMMAEFKSSINDYLKELITSPVRSLADIIAFNERNSDLEKLAEYDQHTFIEAEKADRYGKKEKKVVEKLKNFSRNGFEKMMDHELGALSCLVHVPLLFL